MTCSITSVIPPGPDFPNHPDQQTGQAHDELVLLDHLFSFCENWCTEGKEKGESTGVTLDLDPAKRQTTGQIYVLTQHLQEYPGQLVETEPVCTKCIVHMML